jgi:hypothetical protein
VGDLVTSVPVLVGGLVTSGIMLVGNLVIFAVVSVAVGDEVCCMDIDSDRNLKGE